MNITRSLKRSKTPNSKNIGDCKRIVLFKYDFRDEVGVEVRLPICDSKNPDSMQPVLELANRVLELKRPAKQIFNENDEVITAFSEIQPKMKLFVSCTAPLLEEDMDQTIYKSRMAAQHKATLKKLPIVPQPEYHPKPEDAPFHQAIASSMNDVKDNLRDSLLTIYSALSLQEQHSLSFSSDLKKLSDETMRFSISNSLISQMMGPSSMLLNDLLYEKTSNYTYEKLKSISPGECQFSISGPRQSGKSTLLYSIVTQFLRKLQLSNDIHNYLIIPINWKVQQMFIENVIKLYDLIISTTLNSLRLTHMEFSPLIPLLHKYFMSLIEMPQLPNLPPQILKTNGFPIIQINQLGNSIHKAWNTLGEVSTFVNQMNDSAFKKQITKDGFSEFIELTMSFPNSLAQVFNFISAVYVFDHIDCANLTITPPSRFQHSKLISFPQQISTAIANCPHFIASYDDIQFFKTYILESKQLTTEHIITMPPQDGLFIMDPPISLTFDMCMGCPGYCAQYLHLHKLVSQYSVNKINKLSHKEFQSVVEKSKSCHLKQEFMKFCVFISSSNEDLLSFESIESLNAKDEIEVSKFNK